MGLPRGKKMTGKAVFFMWSIAEAWDWLVHIPGLGFALLIALPFVLIILVVYLTILWATLF